MSVGNLFQARIDLYQTERNSFKSFDRFTWRVAPFVFQMTDFNFANNRFPFRKLQIFGFISQPLNDIIQTTEARLHADAKRELCNVRKWFIPPIKHLTLEICQHQETPSKNNIQAIIIELVHQELVQ